MNNPRPLKIGMYAGSWPQNIGNAFFDFGAEAIIRAAFPTAEIYRVGGAVHWMFNNSDRTRRGKLNRLVRKFSPISHPINGNSIEIGQFAELDLLVFAGMSLCEEFAANNGPTFLNASKNGVAVLGLGAGGSLYTTRESEKFSEFFNKIERAAVITRDDDSYEMFKGKIKNIQKGIDCAFFLPEYYHIPKVYPKNYSVLTFDSTRIPKYLEAIDSQKFYAHHDLWGPLNRKYISKPGTLVSDVPEDYLTLYGNCDTTYSDRVHACIASLAYGNKAQLFSDTPRKALFARLGLEDITSKVVSVDVSLLKEAKIQQISVTRNIVSEIVHV
jgi:polysaccharide pyruvyl transferase WcaK-like protein